MILNFMQEIRRTAELRRPLFAINSRHRGNWCVYDLDEQYIIAREDTREYAIQSMMEFGTDAGTVTRCI